MSLKEKFFRSSLWVVAGTGLNNLASFAVFAVLARLLDPIAIGFVTFAMALVDVSRVVVYGGLPEAVVQRADWDDARSSTCVWANLALAVVVALGLAGAGWVVAVLSSREAGLVIASLAGILVIDAARAIHEAKLRREFGYKKLASRGAIATVLSGLVGILMALGGYGVWALVAQRLIHACTMTALTWAGARWTPRFRVEFAHLREVAPFALRLTPARLLTILNMRMPEFVIGGVLGPAPLAFYRIGARMLEVIAQLTTQPIQQAALSAFSRLPDAPAIGEAYGRLTRASAFLACPVYFGAAVTAPDVIVLVFGERWAPSGLIMAALAAAVGATLFGQFSQAALTAAGRADLVLRSTLGSFAATLATCLATVAWGPASVAIGQTVRNYLSVPFWFSLLRRGVSLDPPRALRGVAAPFLAALAMAAGVVALRTYALADWGVLWRAAASVAFGAALYLALLGAFGRPYLASLRTDLAPLLPGRLRRMLGHRS